MEYNIIEKRPLTLIGIKRTFNSKNSNEEIPKFWDEIMKTSDWQNGIIKGSYGLCYEENGNNFSYMIADDYNNSKTYPKEYEKVELTSTTYASFPCRGQIPEAIQSINDKIFSEWLPNSTDYKQKENYSLEVYINDNYVEVWIPVEKISK